MLVDQLLAPASIIEIIPIGSVDCEVVRFLEKVLSKRFSRNICVSEAIVAPSIAYSSNRHQYNSQLLLAEINKEVNTEANEAKELNKLKNNIPTVRAGIAREGNHDVNCEIDSRSNSAIRKNLAVTSDDLYIDGYNYVFGQAILGGRCAVISLARLNQGVEADEAGHDLFLSRVEKEAVHELGHVFGLRHCPDPDCVMYLSGSLADTDRKSANFCSGCEFRVTQYVPCNIAVSCQNDPNYVE